MTRRKIILDCDPGHDDAIAILLAGKSPALDLQAITTVAGNQTLANTTRNARTVCTVAGITDVPIAAGMDRPLIRPQIVADDIHGESGLGVDGLPEPTVPLADMHAVDLIVQKVMESDGDITLVPIGPLTNIATAMRREPRIVEKVQEIVLMGGAIHSGNVTPAAEFNVYADAEAARIVFESGAPLTMVGLNLTYQAKVTPEVVERIRALDSDVSKFVVQLLGSFAATYRHVLGFEAPPLHDACAVSYLIDPTVFSTRHLYVEVETKGEFTYGATVGDVYDVRKQPPNADVAWTLDTEKFWDIVVGEIGRY